MTGFTQGAAATAYMPPAAELRGRLAACSLRDGRRLPQAILAVASAPRAVDAGARERY